MKTLFRIRFFSPQSDNLKPVLSPTEGSKTCTELRRSIQNPKWAGLLAIAFTLAFGGAVVQAQQTGKIFRIGFLDPSTASGMAVLLDVFRQELSKLGWIEGKNLIIDNRFAEGKGAASVQELAAELVRLRVDLIVVTERPPALA